MAAAGAPFPLPHSLELTAGRALTNTAHSSSPPGCQRPPGAPFPLPPPREPSGDAPGPDTVGKELWGGWQRQRAPHLRGRAAAAARRDTPPRRAARPRSARRGERRAAAALGPGSSRWRRVPASRGPAEAERCAAAANPAPHVPAAGRPGRGAPRAGQGAAGGGSAAVPRPSAGVLPVSPSSRPAPASPGKEPGKAAAVPAVVEVVLAAPPPTCLRGWGPAELFWLFLTRRGLSLDGRLVRE